jgi:hypothetical protein
MAEAVSQVSSCRLCTAGCAAGCQQSLHTSWGTGLHLPGGCADLRMTLLLTRVHNTNTAFVHKHPASTRSRHTGSAQTSRQSVHECCGSWVYRVMHDMCVHGFLGIVLLYSSVFTVLST